MQIVILSPQNITYNTTSVNLTFTISQPTNWISYSLNTQPNSTINGNITLAGLARGTHTITVYANNTQGKTTISNTITFYVDAEDTNLILTVAAGFAVIAVAVIAMGLLLHRRKKATPKS